MGIVELMESVLKRMEERGIKYPDKLFVDTKTVKTTLDGWKSQFIFEDKKEGN